MMTKEQLMPFCAKDYPLLAAFFFQKGYTYATDGAVAVRVPGYVEGAEARERPDMGSVGWPEAGGQAYTPMADYEPAAKLCPECNGVGTVSMIECSDCEGTGEVSWASDAGYEYTAECKMCDGTKRVAVLGGELVPCELCDGAKVVSDDNVYVLIEDTPFSPNILGRLNCLPNRMIGIRNTVSFRTIAHVVFDGGDAIVMPMRHDITQTGRLA